MRREKAPDHPLRHLAHHRLHQTKEGLNMVIIISDCTCPQCGAGETHPEDASKSVLDRRILIRAFKVQTEDGHWWSQCLVCSSSYDADLRETPENHDPNAGWF